ncbi:MAG: site-specific DNA-methyltransferase [Dehalococcoidia bacterium]|nr:site-specific DNA-methyltransferase [Dehalococcoidia bacterium]
MELKTNVLYYGDNLDILRGHILDEAIDLIYLDPPFNSNRSYNVLFRESSGAGSEAQIEAFEDTWHWGPSAQGVYEEVVTGPHQKVARMLQAMVDGLGHNDVTAYLSMMAIRLVELHRVLKPAGALYLHCDPTASHYLKTLMDSIFGTLNFRNEVVWHYGQRTAFHKGHFSRKHDTLLLYAKSAKHRISPISLPWTREDFLTHRHDVLSDADGREYIWTDGGRGKPRYKRYVDEVLGKGKPADSVWEIPIIDSAAKERLGYPTQKPLALLERIVSASSNPGDVVLDPFCGCGTAVHAAHKLGRRWIGIDITHLAIGLIRRRMQDAFPGIAIEVIGEPVDLAGARDLASTKPKQFEYWVVDKLDAHPTGGKGPDLDGVKPFMEFGGKPKRAVISVKGTKSVNPEMIREVLGALGPDKPIGILVILAEPTKGMVAQAAAAGFYDSNGQKHQRLQIMTVREILSGKRPSLPSPASPFAKAPLEKEKGEQGEML